MDFYGTLITVASYCIICVASLFPELTFIPVFCSQQTSLFFSELLFDSPVSVHTHRKNSMLLPFIYWFSFYPGKSMHFVLWSKDFTKCNNASLLCTHCVIFITWGWRHTYSLAKYMCLLLNSMYCASSDNDVINSPWQREKLVSSFLPNDSASNNWFSTLSSREEVDCWFSIGIMKNCFLDRIDAMKGFKSGSQKLILHLGASWSRGDTWEWLFVLPCSGPFQLLSNLQG